MAKCAISGCDNPVECPGTGTCKACYQSILNWTKKRPAHIMQRARNIEKYSARMQVIVPSNTALIKPKRIELIGMPGTLTKKYKLKHKKTNKLKIVG